MRRFILIIAFAVSAVPAAYSQQIKGPGDGTIQRDTIGVFEAVDANGAPIPAKFAATPPGRVSVVNVGESAVHVAGPPGEYSLMAAVIIGGKPDLISRSFRIVGDVAPTPPPPGPTPPGPTPPGPTPPPPSDFGPVAKVLFTVETRALTGREPFRAASVVAALASLVPEGSGPAGQNWEEWRVWDVDATPEEEGWLDLWAKARGTPEFGRPPAVFFYDQQGRVRAHPMPSTDADMLALIGRYANK